MLGFEARARGLVDPGPDESLREIVLGDVVALEVVRVLVVLPVTERPTRDTVGPQLGWHRQRPMLADERDAALWRALDQMPERCRALIRVLMASPPPSYAEVAAALDMPIGSIGPTRQRCLDRLRRIAEADGALVDPAPPGGGGR